MGTPQPTSLASLLSIPADAHGSNAEPTHDETELLDYLKENYSAADDVNDALSTPNKTPKPSKPIPNPSLPLPRSPSPIDHSIKIDPALAEVADQEKIIDTVEVPPPSFWLPNHEDEYGMLGEMGGKRRKAPHERAGWKEMDEDASKKNNRRKQPGDKDGVMQSGIGVGGGTPSNVGAVSSTSTQESTQIDMQGPIQNQGQSLDLGPGNLERDLIMAHTESGGLQDGGAEMYQTMGVDPPPLNGEGSGQEGELSGQTNGALHEGGKKRKRDIVEAKEARAEQNRRAQQAFRRRREEKMKGLEAAAAALEPTQRRLQDVETRLVEANLALEAAKIDAAALRSAIRTVAQASGSSILTKDGTLAINATLPTKPGPSDTKEVEDAFYTLSRQARELAKQNRARRGF